MIFESRDPKRADPMRCANRKQKGDVKRAVNERNEEDEEGSDNKKDKLGLNKISRKITFDQNPGAQEPATLKSSCLSTPRDLDDDDEDHPVSSPSVSGGSQVTTLHVRTG